MRFRNKTGTLQKREQFCCNIQWKSCRMLGFCLAFCTFFQGNMILIISTSTPPTLLSELPYTQLCVCDNAGADQPVEALVVLRGGGCSTILFYYVCILIISQTENNSHSTKIHLGEPKSSQSGQSNIIIYVFFGQLLPNYSIPCEIMCPFFV